MDHDSGGHGYAFKITRRGSEAFFSVINEEDDFHFMNNLYSAASVSAAGGDNFVDDLFD